MYLIGIDIGSSTAKTGVFTADGRLVQEAEGSYQASPDPLSWWEAAASILREVMPAGEIAGVCVGSQGPTLVALEQNLSPVCSAILWMDLRAKKEAKLLEAKLGRSISPAWIVPKALWLKANYPELYSRSRWLVQAMDYVTMKLTGKISAGIASPDIVPWSQEEISAANLDASKFPRFLKIGEVLGEVTEEASRATGLPKGTPVFSGAPDFVEAMLGTAAIEKGLVCNKGGTSDGIEFCWDKELRDPRFFCAPHPVSPEMWHLGATVSAAGKSLEWLASILCLTLEETIDLAEDAPAGSKGVIFLPHLTAERSPLFENAKGGFFSLSLDHNRPDLARAVLEGSAFSIRRVISALLEIGGEPKEIRTTGGQSRSRLWNQIKADIAGLEVVRTEAVHGEVLGAAMIAAWGAGLYPDLHTASLQMVRLGERFYPRREAEEVYKWQYLVREELYVFLKRVPQLEEGIGP